MLKHKIAIVLITLSSFQYWAQDDEVQTNYFEIFPTFNLGLQANLNDFYLDFGVGAEENKSRIGAQLNFAFRPFYKKVQINQEPNIIRQWKEKKYFISCDVYKRILDFELGSISAGFLAGVKTGYLFGDYRGTRERPKAGITVNPFVGVGLDLDGVFLQISYLQFNDRLASVPNGRLMFSFCFLIRS